jgi:hypothetical protein
LSEYVCVGRAPLFSFSSSLPQPLSNRTSSNQRPTDRHSSLCLQATQILSQPHYVLPPSFPHNGIPHSRIFHPSALGRLVLWASTLWRFLFAARPKPLAASVLPPLLSRCPFLPRLISRQKQNVCSRRLLLPSLISRPPSQSTASVLFTYHSPLLLAGLCASVCWTLYSNRALVRGQIGRRLRRGRGRQNIHASHTLRSLLLQGHLRAWVSPQYINYYPLALRKPGVDTITEQDEPVTTTDGHRLPPVVASPELVPRPLSIKKRKTQLSVAR